MSLLRLHARAGGAAACRHRYALGVLVGFVVVRACYWKMGVRFDARTLDFYMQIVDPELLRTDLARSIFYLRDQPPLFNAFIGLALKLFPSAYAHAMQAAYVCMGAVGALASYALALRLRAGAPAAALLALAVSSAPFTVLYENWLFYTHPLAMLWVVVGLSGYAVLRRPTAWRSFGFSGALSLVALTRGTVHLVVVLAVVVALALVRRVHVRRVLLGAALPVLVVVRLYVKHAAVFGGVVIGDAYRGLNLAFLQSYQIDKATLALFAKEGRLPPGCPALISARLDLESLLEDANLALPALRGIPILDEAWKSTGMTSWNSSAAEVVCRNCERVGKALRTLRPDAYGAAVRGNLARYFAPADFGQPLGGAGTASRQLLTLRAVADRIAVPVGRGRVSITVVTGIALAFLLPGAGLLRRARRWRDGERWRVSAELGVQAFTAGMLASSMVVVTLFSWGDQNRYRAELMSLVWVVAGATLVRGLRAGYRVARKRLFGRSATTAGAAAAEPVRS